MACHEPLLVRPRPSLWARRRYGDRVILSGQSLASVLSLPIYGGDVRMWLEWPATPDERHRLHNNLRDFADATGATVWAPPVAGSAQVIPGCADLGVVDYTSQPARWHMYGPHGMTGPATFESDLDGRLVPVDGVWTARAPGTSRCPSATSGGFRCSGTPQLRIERRQALDVAAGAKQWSMLTSVRPRPGQLSEAGIDLILPTRSYERISVTRSSRHTTGIGRLART